MNSMAGNLPEAVQQLCKDLHDHAAQVDLKRQWPSETMSWLAEADVFRWFIPPEYGGDGWSEDQILDGYLALSQSCITSTFILTQWNAACKRILGSTNEELKQDLLPAMADGSLFATVGISHLTTSRQHLAKPVLIAQRVENGFMLNGFSPWVTSAAQADVIVLGASLDDGTQIIAAVSTESEGLEASPGADLVALSSSCTDAVKLENVFVSESRIVAGPVENVLQTNSGGGAGGLQTSTLALGLTLASVEYLHQQAEKRQDLVQIAQKMEQDAEELCGALRDLNAGESCSMDAAELRQRANSLVLRCTQAALSAAKGAGFMASHPAGRWAREALFFLVWSCPQPVVSANLCELAQIAGSEP